MIVMMARENGRKCYVALASFVTFLISPILLCQGFITPQQTHVSQPFVNPDETFPISSRALTRWATAKSNKENQPTSTSQGDGKVMLNGVGVDDGKVNGIGVDDNFFKTTSKDDADLKPTSEDDWDEENDEESEFNFQQRIESIKSGVIGGIWGGLSVAPFTALHDIYFGGEYVQNGVAQFEFDTDTGFLEAALFSIVYRYCVRKDDNPMLEDGIVGAFALVRTFSKIQIPYDCSAVPLSCGPPLEYFNWDMLIQGGFAGLESFALFGGAAVAMDYALNKTIIARF